MKKVIFALALSALSTSAFAAEFYPGARLEIISAAAGMAGEKLCMGAVPSGDANEVRQTSCNKGLHQIFIVRSNNNGSIVLSPQDKISVCVEVKAPDPTADKVLITERNCNEAVSFEHFRFNRQQNTSYTITVEADGKCLDVPAGVPGEDLSHGTPLQQYHCKMNNGGPEVNQTFFVNNL